MEITENGGKRTNKSKSSCCVPGCTKTGYLVENGKPVTFHRLPTVDKILNQWIERIRRDVGSKFQVTKHTKICSRHFHAKDIRTTPKGQQHIKSSALPSIFPWSKMTKPRTNPLDKINSEETTGDETTNMEIEMSPAVQTLEQNCKNCQRLQTLETELKAKEDEIKMLKTKLEISEKEKKYLQVSLEKKLADDSPKYLTIEDVKDCDDDVSFFTGFPNYKLFMMCFDYLNVGENCKHIKYCYETATEEKKIYRPRTLKPLDEFFLVLIRLRLGLFEHDIAKRYNVSDATVSRIWTSWINFMYLRLGSIDIWPTKEEITNTMPQTMLEKFPNLEWIIDAFEIQCERSSSLMLQSQSYSNYKSRNTLKGLVACTPSGQLGFVSQLYLGSISDRELVIRSRFLKMPHRQGAMWLADKGFTIQDLATPLGVTVNIPAFLGQNKQMSADDVFHTQQVASERIHIERAINKIKNFHFFDRPIPLTCYGIINQAWTVAALLTLFQNPIISA